MRILPIHGLWLTYLLAQSTGGLVVVSETGEPFRLFLNGEWVTEGPVTRAEAHNLPEGPQRATLYIHPSEGRVIQIKKTFYIEAGYTEYYAISKRKNKYVINLFNRIEEELPSTPTPSPISSAPPPSPAPSTPSPAASPPSSGNTATSNTTIIFNPTIQVQTGSGTQVNSPAPSASAPTVPSTPSATPVGTGYVGPCNCPLPTPSTEIQRLAATLQREAFEDTRLQMAKAMISRNCLRAADVQMLVGLFTLENAKLELAKFAYDYTHDLSNYLVVGDALGFSLSRTELAQYVQSRSAKYSCPTTPSPPAPASRTCVPCMGASAFAQALQTLRQASTEAARLDIARQVSATNCLSAQQVREVCQVFATEESRLTFAKTAYARCCDPQNYFIVNQVFTTAYSQQELARYIQEVSGR
ncbi:MAG: DUF4476 domain-containing protein [Bacteroidia bacterium]|nr:DUF4476 domain-containing protein [Bacteroidia bacterium]MDW8088814.1 DUF4476 domain-containing protein [Bacteroidia bacterium]